MSTTSPTMSRPRGRPQRLPVDPTSWQSADLACSQRIAWLLAVTRLLSPASRSGGRSGFISAMAEVGLRLDSSRVSRLETGDHYASAAVIAGYERVTGTPEGAIQAVAAVVRRVAGGAEHAENRSELSDDELDTIFDRLECGRADGGDWLRLSWDLQHREHVYLPPSTWSLIAAQMMGELTRSTGLAHVRRHEAATTLLQHPTGRRHLSLGLGRFVMHPNVQSVAPALSLLKEAPEDSAADLVLRMLSGPSPLLRRGAAGVVGSLAANHSFLADREPALEHHLMGELQRPNLVLRRPDALDLASRLSDASYRRVIRSLPDPGVRVLIARVCGSYELVERDVSRATVEGIATYAEAAAGRAAHDPDQMLRRLIREALFHVHRSRRRLAAIVLASSPYARPVADATLRVACDGDEVTAGLAYSLLRRLGHVLDRAEVAECAEAETRPDLKAAALLTMGLSRGDLPESMAAQLASLATTSHGTRLGHAATYALGMAGHESLTDLADAPGPAREAAAWWAQAGGAIHDE